MIFTKEAIESLNKKLELPSNGIEQDWDIELANSKRLGEFVSFYEQSDLSSEEKKAMMALIFASYDDFLNEVNIDRNNLWSKIVRLIKQDDYLFHELLNYWRLEDENSSENYFKITPLVRGI